MIKCDKDGIKELTQCVFHCAINFSVFGSIYLWLCIQKSIEVNIPCKTCTSEKFAVHLKFFSGNPVFILSLILLIHFLFSPSKILLTILYTFLFFMFLNMFLLTLEREKGGERDRNMGEKETSMGCLRDWAATQACTLSRNRTRDSWCRERCPTTWASHTRQASPLHFKTRKELNFYSSTFKMIHSLK